MTHFCQTQMFELFLQERIFATETDWFDLCMLRALEGASGARRQHAKQHLKGLAYLCERKKRSLLSRAFDSFLAVGFVAFCTTGFFAAAFFCGASSSLLSGVVAAFGFFDLTAGLATFASASSSLLSIICRCRPSRTRALSKKHFIHGEPRG